MKEQQRIYALKVIELLDHTRTISDDFPSAPDHSLPSAPPSDSVRRADSEESENLMARLAALRGPPPPAVDENDIEARLKRLGRNTSPGGTIDISKIQKQEPADDIIAQAQDMIRLEGGITAVADDNGGATPGGEPTITNDELQAMLGGGSDFTDDLAELKNDEAEATDTLALPSKSELLLHEAMNLISSALSEDGGTKMEDAAIAAIAILQSASGGR